MSPENGAKELGDVSLAPPEYNCDPATDASLRVGKKKSKMKPAVSSILVLKLGGSLFDVPDLFRKIETLWGGENVPLWIVPGGGGFVEEIRRLDAVHNWPAQMAHQLALSAMSLTARMVVEGHSQFDLVHSPAECRIRPHRIKVIDIASWDEVRTLPASWDLTSDSIAAWIAFRFGSGRLLLAKSVGLPKPVPALQVATDLQLVDACFPDYAGRLQQVDWINLRDPFPEIQPWRSTSQDQDRPEISSIPATYRQKNPLTP